MDNKKELIYDSIIIGSSPNLIFEGILRAYNGEKVLILEKNDRIGGAWSTIDLNFKLNAEANCHILLRNPLGYKVLTLLGVRMVPVNPQPKIYIRPIYIHYNSFFRYLIRTYEHFIKREFFTKKKEENIKKVKFGLRDIVKIIKTTIQEVLSRKIYYAKGGVSEINSVLENNLTKLGGKILINTECLRIEKKHELIIIYSKKERFQTNNIILSKGSNISHVVLGKQNFYFKSHTSPSIQFYFMIKDNSMKKISYLLLFKNKFINRVSEHNCSHSKKIRILTLQIHKHQYAKEKEKKLVNNVFNELKLLKLINDNAELVMYDIKKYHAFYKSEQEIKKLKKIFGSSLYFLKIDDVSKTLNKQIKDNEIILDDNTFL